MAHGAACAFGSDLAVSPAFTSRARSLQVSMPRLSGGSRHTKRAASAGRREPGLAFPSGCVELVSGIRELWLWKQLDQRWDCAALATRAPGQGRSRPQFGASAETVSLRVCLMRAAPASCRSHLSGSMRCISSNATGREI